MAPFDVNSVCWRVVHDAAFHNALASEPERALRETGVNADERAALLAGDVKTLYELGASPFLMEHLANHRVLGLDPERYSERIRQATWVAP